VTEDDLAPGDDRDLGPARERVHRFLDHIERGENHLAVALALRSLDEVGPSAVVTELLAPVQREVGDRWHAGRYTVAQEHLASAVVDDVLGLLAPRASQATDHEPHTLALVCAEGEWHATPARMAALLARDAGWQVHFLGASTPADHLRSTLEVLRPQALAVSCTLPLALPGVPTLVDVADHLDVPVVVGGRAFDAEGRRGGRLGAHGSFTDVGEALRALDVWLDAPPTRTPPTPDDDVAAQRAQLHERRPTIVDEAYRHLEARLPMMADFDDRRRHHTRQDLDYLLRFADVALLADDPRIFDEFVAWLAQLLAVRGVPPPVLTATLEAVDACLDDELPAVRELLTLAAFVTADA
jgi:methanogenic corrinoid protein MtbC1